MTREDAMRGFDLLRENEIPVNITGNYSPHISPSEYWHVSIGNIDHIGIKKLVGVVEKEGFALRATTIGQGMVIDLMTDQERRRITG